MYKVSTSDDKLNGDYTVMIEVQSLTYSNV